MFVALKPDKSPLGLYPDMTAAQTAIAADEACVLRQGLYQIHPIKEPEDATRLNIKLIYDLKLEKFEGEGNQGPLLDVFEYHGET
jgi:hypothetical protein